MKEGRSSDSVEYISDEFGDDVEEHGDQDKLSIFFKKGEEAKQIPTS